MNKQGWNDKQSLQTSQDEPFDSKVVVSTDPDAGRILTGSDECWVTDPIHFLLSSMVVIATSEIYEQHPGKALTIDPIYWIDFYAKSIEESQRPYKLCHLGDMWQYSKRSKTANIVMTHVQKKWTTPEGETKTKRVEIELSNVLHERIIDEFKKLWEEKHPGIKFNVFKANKEFGNKGTSAIIFTVSKSLFAAATELAGNKHGKIRETDPVKAVEVKEIAKLIRKHCPDELKDISYEYEYIPNWIEFKNIHNPILFMKYTVEDGPEQTYARRFVTPNYAKNVAYSVPKYWPPREYKMVYSGDEASGVKVN